MFDTWYAEIRIPRDRSELSDSPFWSGALEIDPTTGYLSMAYIAPSMPFSLHFQLGKYANFAFVGADA